MKNTKLEVIRINADVIATSGEFCTDHRNHYYFTEVNTFPVPNEADGTFCFYYNNKWYKKQGFGPVDLGEGNIKLITYTTDKYYVANADNTGLVECTNNHNLSAAEEYLD